MKNFTIYDGATGEIKVSGYCQDEDFDLHRQDGLMLMEGASEPDKHYILNGEAVEKGEQPNPLWTFDYTTKQWIDPRTPEQVLAAATTQFETAVQSHLDAFAQSWRYDSMLSAASYAASTVSQFKNEAAALIAWRDSVWNACYAALAQVEAGTLPMPESPAAFIATLPAEPVRP